VYVLESKDRQLKILLHYNVTTFMNGGVSINNGYGAPFLEKVLELEHLAYLEITHLVMLLMPFVSLKP